MLQHFIKKRGFLHMDLAKIKAIVFDLDGTLYEDTHHFDYYANQLREKLHKDVQPIFEKEYALAKEDQHTLRMGRVYDVEKDLVLVQLDNQVVEAYEWNGEALPNDKLKSLYPDPITLDFIRFINVGDLWWVPVSIALHNGLPPEQAESAFLETRNFMMGPDYEMKRIPGLKDLLESLHSKIKLVLLTNSPEPDSEMLLQKLGISSCFDLKLFNGKKPVRTVERFETVKETFNVSFEEILSVGDNWINEIRPVQPLGCATIFIDTHHLDGTADLIVETMGEVITYLEKLK
jgi:FMN phosphatase YigB (HAD superfamily)